MGLESAANIALLIAIVGLMLFFLRRMDRMKDELKRDISEVKADMVRMEAGIRADMSKMEAGHKEDMARLETGMAKMEADLKADINLKHGEVRQDLQDVRHGLMEVRERQARLEGILEGRGVIPTPEPAATAE